MTRHLPAYALLFAISAIAYASDWGFSYRPASVRYVMYGNSLGDTMPPSSSDQKVAFEITGRAARDMFDALGPDQPDACVAEPGIRFRARNDGKISCSRSGDGDYTCHFGFDLKSGQSIGGTIC